MIGQAIGPCQMLAQLGEGGLVRRSEDGTQS